MSKDTSPPAFPLRNVFDILPDDYSGGEHNASWRGHLGMTLRDYFAGQALLGIVMAYDSGGLGPSSIANEAYELADAMLEERLKSMEGK